MSDAANPNRVEPSFVPPAGGTATARTSEQLRAAVEGAVAGPVATSVPDAPRAIEGQLDQLSRIEEKAARLEEKQSRSEAQMLRLGDRVEAATSRMNEAARQADLAALRTEVRELSGRVRRLPGFVTLVLWSILTALLSAAAVAAVMRYGIPGFLPPR
ncbi:MAG TPA: hypothetical protein VIL65_12430 [Beijerinckiaceae bacterium]|jgi:hypothetical protein